MRFNLNQTLFAVHFSFQRGARHFMQPLMYSEEMPSAINIIKLTVKEHRKVHTEYEDRKKEAPTHDAFILEGEDGNIYHNQYPTASYGQLHDEANRRFNRRFESGTLEEIMAKEPAAVFSYHLLSDVMEKMVEGIKKLGELPTDHTHYAEVQRKIELLKTLTKQITDTFVAKYPTHRLEARWKPLFKGDTISTAESCEVSVYRHLQCAEFATIAEEEVLADLLSFGRVEVEYSTGDRLRLLNTENLNSVLGDVSDVDCYRLSYLEKLDFEEGEDAAVAYNVHQSEFFHLSDAAVAAKAMFERFMSEKPLRAINLGVSEEEIIIRLSQKRMKATEPKYLVNSLNENNQLQVSYTGGMKYTLKKFDECVYGIMHSMPASDRAGEDLYFHTTSMLPTPSALAAIVCFQKLLDNPPSVIKDAGALVAEAEKELGIDKTENQK